jgi:uncharacterized membrane protein YfcA
MVPSIFAAHAPLIVTLTAALVIGALIGSIGIGGILLSPFLIDVVGLDVRDAITVSTASFIAAGLVALAIHPRSERNSLVRGWPLVVATVPGALLGAVTLAFASKRVSLALLAALLVSTGVRVLARGTPHARGAPHGSVGVDCAVGALSGFVSALTGTGGPMVLVPIQLWRGVPLLAAVALGQVVQLPIAATATFGNWMSGGVDFVTAALIGAMLVPGVLVGHRIAEVVPLAALARVVALLLIVVGAWFVIRAMTG